ncbi:MAG: D-glycero-beta-D-manno-heptose 1-phosphate adenylyltransferase [Chitinophagaceae bacterium]|jgi:rfaE bifunctional protein nucleotidyltransferase chain/domain|nr:D-glycero-beta-D-manno-heptose 1-phosphate adenylyltransferase [Chitinophagaceae bacterium]MCA6468930.1 D-glycero-beta-D-manno-heptose 1-phosphate adenylyltransferase [Chitinophagaceae bacterium]MCA6476678.1 D-glycero-beta-D-manno-heptose 1-phosphate adenylyltransferase [Chitinophagaceae bacterium]MCA6479021.1 D-glycero-beta-D-manno-heptose 1-phosphate adenylyltransferase [Chitinophagaceae bacterium]MCA6484464.1 D-glycero-beta-D-manno-heptose 1-phosphate adenylyltransferase [Chitinophagaceae
MKTVEAIRQKIILPEQLVHQAYGWKMKGKTIAFTNGCFDILHEGHIFSLSSAAKEADYLIVGLNSDSSTRSLKGPERPINHEQSRALMLASLIMVDAVVIFNESTPLQLIQLLEPDVLVKGGDYQPDQVVGAQEVIARGGKVVINPLVEGFSTTGLIQRIKTSLS